MSQEYGTEFPDVREENFQSSEYYGVPPGAGMGPPPGAGMSQSRYIDQSRELDFDDHTHPEQHVDAEYEAYEQEQQEQKPSATTVAVETGDGFSTGAGATQTQTDYAQAAMANLGQLKVDASQYPDDYIEAFQIYDKEFGDDRISAAMLGTVLRALGQNPTEGQLAELIQTMGKDVYTVADVDYILQKYDLRDQCSSTEIKDMWEMVAGEGQTFVQKTILQSLLSKIGDKILEPDFNKIMMAANANGDVVTFEQFQRIMTN